MAKGSWRDDLWQFYEGVFGKNYRNYIHRLSNRENEVAVSFHVKGDELVVHANPSSLRVIRYGQMKTDHPQEIHNSGFSRKELKVIAPLIKEAQLR